MPKNGPILTVMESVPGTPSNHKGDSGDSFDGLNGYPASSGGKLPELTFVNNGGFGTVKKTEK